MRNSAHHSYSYSISSFHKGFLTWLAVVVPVMLIIPACPPNPVPPTPPNFGDAGESFLDDANFVYDSGNDECGRAEDWLRSHMCRYPDGLMTWRTVKGTPWSIVCRQALGDDRDLRPDCVLQLKSCADFNKIPIGHRGARVEACP